MSFVADTVIPLTKCLKFFKSSGITVMINSLMIFKLKSLVEMNV